MKFALKLNYRYISVGNFNQKVEYQYYQIFDNGASELLSLGYHPDEKVELKSITEDCLKVTYSYSRYVHPRTFCHDSERITKEYTLRKYQKVSMEGNDMYYNYATGGENGWAELEAEWITYEEFFDEIMEEINSKNEKVSSFAYYLIENKQYDSAFKLLSNSEKDQHSYLLANCYEFGYGVEKDIEKAIEIYLYESAYFPCKEGLQRCLKEKEGKEVIIDDCKMMVLAEQYGIKETIRKYIHIPLSKGDNSFEELRRCMTKRVKDVITEDRYSKDMESMEQLAKYYDMVNDIPENKRPMYSKEFEEYDPYNSDTYSYVRYYSDKIIATLQKEALKDDVVAIGVLILRFNKEIDNEEELVNKLIELSKEGEEKEQASYYLGLYYERKVKDETKANYYFNLASSLRK